MRLYTLLFILLLPLSGPVDYALSRWCLEQFGSSPNDFCKHPVLDFIYSYGPLPAYLFGYGGGLFLLLSLLFEKWKEGRPAALAFFLMLGLGCGLIVNVTLKDQWGRPRPCQTLHLGGSHPFHPCYRPHLSPTNELCRSFPCGHCTMGFYFFILPRITKRSPSTRWKRCAQILPWVLGVLLGGTRMLQGGHFFSDVLVGGWLMYLLAKAVDWFCYEKIFPTSPLVCR